MNFDGDAQKWAKFFIKTKEDNNWTVDDIDEGLMIGWFANAIMEMNDIKEREIDELRKQIIQQQKDLLYLINRNSVDDYKYSIK